MQDLGPCLHVYSFLFMDVASVYFVFRLFSPQVTSRMCGRTHGRGCVAF